MNDKVKECRAEIVEKMIKAMEEGTAPWMRPWTDTMAPRNATSGRFYSGVNAFYLDLVGMMDFGGTDPRWATFAQAQKAGWAVKKGERGTRVVFWDLIEKPVMDEKGRPIITETGEEKKQSIPFGRVYTVFNGAQIVGIPAYAPTENIFDKIEKAEKIITDSGATIRHGGNRAAYSPTLDVIRMPPRGIFGSIYDYYATILHELAHWTGHTSRLNRPFGPKRSETYAREELVAEMASVFISAETAIPQTPAHFANHAAYVAHWINLLKNDGDALFRAARDASKAADYILKNEHGEADKGAA